MEWNGDQLAVCVGWNGDQLAVCVYGMEWRPASSVCMEWNGDQLAVCVWNGMETS